MVENSPVRRISKSSFRLFAALNLIDADGGLLPSGIARVIQSLPLDEQCKILGLPFTEIELPNSGMSVETDALTHMAIDSGLMTFSESGVFCAMYECVAQLCLPEFKSRRPNISFENVYFGLGLHLLGPWKQQGISTELATSYFNYFQDRLNKLERDEFNSAVQQWFPNSYYQKQYPKLSCSDIEKLFDVIHPDEHLGLIKFLAESRHHQTGWPDIAFVTGNRLRLAEVKAWDRLHYSQIRCLPRLAKVLRDVSVLRVKRI
jgi:hypothetical protein